MSEDKTQEFDEHQSFEKRVFARFDAIDLRLDTMEDRFEGRLVAVEIRITKLEDRQYDTKPIWEQALAAILEVRSDVAELKSDVAELKSDVAKNTVDLASHTESIASLQSGIAELRTEMNAGFTSVRNEVEHQVRSLDRKLVALNDNWLELKGDQSYLDRRLAHLEEQIKPT